MFGTLPLIRFTRLGFAVFGAVCASAGLARSVHLHLKLLREQSVFILLWEGV